MPKTGADHLNSLRDGRTIYLDGQRISDVVEHPAYRNAVRSTARLYDFQAAPANLERMTFPSPTTGERVNRCWQLPSSYADRPQAGPRIRRMDDVINARAVWRPHG